MSWGEVFLGVIAASTLVTALIQIGAIIAGVRLAKRVGAVASRIDRELQPTVAHVRAIGQEVSNAAALATVQVRRVDALLADIGRRTEHGLNTLEGVVTAPARESHAILAGLRAIVSRLKRGTEENGNWRSHGRAE